MKTLDLSQLESIGVEGPDPNVNRSDLRFVDHAIEVEESHGNTALMARIKAENGDSQVLKQYEDGTVETVTEKHLRYAIPYCPQRTEIRVFLSSTFQDMQAERDYLANVTFPRLKQFAESRGLAFTEIDLRWGVTAEEVENGAAVAICLNEIEKCRSNPPFFIGLLGERYGWIPDAAALAALNDAVVATPGHSIDNPAGRVPRDGLSVTEMEISYGVLSSPKDHRHSFFYFRSLPLTELLQRKTGPDGFVDDKKDRLDRLKNELRHQNLVRLDGYRSIKELADDIELGLRAAITRISSISVRSQTQGIPESYWAHVGYCKHAEMRRIELHRTSETKAKCFERSYYKRSGIPPITLLVGKPGSGKLTEACDIAKGCVLGDLSVIPFHCRMFPSQTSTSCIDYLTECANAIFSTNALAPKGSLSQLFNLASGPVALLLTDIDQLANREELLLELSRIQNPQVSIVLTSTEPIPIQCEHTVVRVGDLTSEQRRAFVGEYLARFRKKLDAGQVSLLEGMALSASIDSLSVILDELRRESFESLPSRISFFSSIPTRDDLFDYLLNSWDALVPSGSRDKVAKVLMALAVSCRGLVEDYIVDMAGIGMPRLHWATLSGRASGLIANVGRSWVITSENLRQAIFRKLSLESDIAGLESWVRKNLISYLSSRTALNDDLREEMEYQKKMLNDVKLK